MTLTTEWLKERLKNPRSGTEFELINEVLANREAQPAGFYTTVSGRKGVVWHNGAPEDDTAIYTAPPAPEITDEAIDRIVVPLSPDELDEEKYPCEWHLYHDRERIRKELREYFARPPAPAAPEGGNG